MGPLKNLSLMLERRSVLSLRCRDVSELVLAFLYGTRHFRKSEMLGTTQRQQLSENLEERAGLVFGLVLDDAYYE